MSGKGLSYGLNITKKPALGSRPAPTGRKNLFADDDDLEENDNGATEIGGVEEIGEFGGLSSTTASGNGSSKPSHGAKSKSALGNPKKGPINMYGDLSDTFNSKKHADKAADVDPSIIDYDSFLESKKSAQKKVSVEDQERKPKYMGNLIAAANLRKRDAAIAEEKRLAKEREAEGDEFADKEKFVTSAYKKQQEENRRLEEEERRREEEEQKKNKGTGMTSFYKNLLSKNEEKHAEVVKAAAERAKDGPEVEDEEKKTKTEADIAKEINAKKAGAIAINDEGQVVDKRQLLKGGLNLVPKPKGASSVQQKSASTPSSRNNVSNPVGSGGGKQAMRERQTRMMEAQLEQATKRTLEEEEEERAKVERASKSRKTEGDISSARERYLARKREAEEAKKAGG